MGKRRKREFIVHWEAEAVGTLSGFTATGVAARYAAHVGLSRGDIDINVTPLDEAKPALREAALAEGPIKLESAAELLRRLGPLLKAKP